MSTANSLLHQAPEKLWRRVARRAQLLAVAAVALGLTASAAFAQTTTTTLPTKGTLRVACLRIEFVPDVPPAPPVTNPPTPQAPQLPSTRFLLTENDKYFRDAMTKVSDYFKEVSLGNLTLSVTIGPVVQERDYDKDMAYYALPATQPQSSAALMQRAIDLSEGAGFSLSQYDLIIVFHAGSGLESDFLGTSTNLLASRYLQTPLTSASGKSFAGAVLQSADEIQPAVGEDLSIIGRTALGVAEALGAVRTGSGIGMPSDSSYTGVWDLMDRGWMLGKTLPLSNRTDWSTPAHINPMEKIRMGWVTPTVVTANMPGASIPQVETTGTVYRMWKQGAVGKEYFLVENRQTVGYDIYLPGSGLMVWHINENSVDQSNPQALRVQVLQADGRQDIENQVVPYGDASDPFPGQLAVKTIDDNTAANMRDATGTETQLSITQISSSGQVMTANLYITPPMILSYQPAAGFSTESVTPTFKASFSDTIDAQSITVNVDGRILVDKTNISTYYNTAAREISFKPSALSFGQHTYNISVKDITGAVSESTGDLVFRVNFLTIPAGLRMVAVPYKLVSPANDPGTVFGAGSVRLARWSAPQAKYLFYPEQPQQGLNPPPDDSTAPSRVVGAAPAGLAYWINLTTDSPVRITGDQVDSVAYPIPLFTGWNMIGDPFVFAVDWNGVQLQYQGQLKTLADAVSAGWVSGTLYTYGSGGYTWQTAPQGQLYPWQGYWVKAMVPATLLVPPLQSGIGSLRSAAPPAAADGWRFRLAVRSRKGAADTYNFIGVSRSARDGADSQDVEKPPVPMGGTVALRLVENGRSLAQDLKSPEIGTSKSWDFEVDTDLQQETLDLSWPDVSQLPSNLDARIEDLTTGRKISVRSQGGYSYNCGQGGTRRFRLTVMPRQSAPLMLTGIVMERTRGVGALRFTLNRDAVVDATVTDMAGRVVRQLLRDQPATAGMNVAATGRADAYAPGIYLIQVTATATDGASVRGVQPMVVVR